MRNHVREHQKTVRQQLQKNDLFFFFFRFFFIN